MLPARGPSTCNNNGATCGETLQSRCTPRGHQPLSPAQGHPVATQWVPPPPSSPGAAGLEPEPGLGAAALLRGWGLFVHLRNVSQLRHQLRGCRVMSQSSATPGERDGKLKKKRLQPLRVRFSAEKFAWDQGNGWFLQSHVPADSCQHLGPATSGSTWGLGLRFLVGAGWGQTAQGAPAAAAHGVTSGTAGCGGPARGAQVALGLCSCRWAKHLARGYFQQKAGEEAGRRAEAARALREAGAQGCPATGARSGLGGRETPASIPKSSARDYQRIQTFLAEMLWLPLSHTPAWGRSDSPGSQPLPTTAMLWLPAHGCHGHATARSWRSSCGRSAGPGAGWAPR